MNEYDVSVSDTVRLNETLNMSTDIDDMTHSQTRRFVLELQNKLEQKEAELQRYKEKTQKGFFPARNLGDKPFAIVAEGKVAKCNRHPKPSDQTAWADGKWLKINARGDLNIVITHDQNGKPHSLFSSGITAHACHSFELDNERDVESAIKRYVHNHDM